MKTHIYLNESGKRKLLCNVELEVVPGGTYVIDGVPYKLMEKPVFVIGNEDRSGNHQLQWVELTVEKTTETFSF